MFFMASLLSYVWRMHLTGVDTFVPLTPRRALGPRIAISAIVALGFICLVLVIRTLAAKPRRQRQRDLTIPLNVTRDVQVGEQEAQEETNRA
jgi:hypothetical protein